MPRGRRWGARLIVGKAETWLGTFDTPQQAAAAVKEAKRLHVRTSLTVAEWAQEWMSLYPGRRSEETAAHNAQMVARFAAMYGRLDLQDVSPLIAQRWAVKHPGTVRYLRLMFAKAVKAGLVDRNVWTTVEIPTQSSRRRAVTLEELDRITAAAVPRAADCFTFMAYTGLRASEVCDVQTADLLDAGTRLLVRGKRRAGDERPRERRVAVFPAARAAVDRQAPELGRVFRSPTGRPLTRRTVWRLYTDAAARAGVVGTSPHSLRHFHASWLLSCGASERDVAQQLGHVDDAGHVDTTQVRRTYGHADAESALLRLEAVAVAR